jgi:23S rRNA (uracil1939-C5)-methyltransferase
VEEACVLDLNHDGEGIVKEGKTAFVAGALPGERIRYLRGRRYRRHDEARLIEVLEPAPERVVPRCAHVGLCGGCSLQHLDPAAQLVAKQREVAESLLRIARVEPERWLPPLSGPVWSYRRRARLGVRYVAKKGRVVVGFRERSAPYVADCLRCEVLAPPVDALLTPLAELVGRLSIRERLPQIEVAIGDHATVLVLRTLSPPNAADREALLAFEREHAVKLLLQAGQPDALQPVSEGPAELSYSLPQFDLELRFGPVDFVQVNGAMNRLLVARAVELLEIEPKDRILDLYCGLGNFTLALARRGAQAIGVEGEAALVERARDNARRNGLENTSFQLADLTKPLEPTLPWLRGGFTKILLDPPRAGAREVLATLAGLCPERILYISCHPGSLARDVGVLVGEFGLTLRAAGVVDMFPHTNHVESIALLEPARPVRR